MGVHEFVSGCVEHGSKAEIVESQVDALITAWLPSDSQLLFQVTAGTEQPGRRNNHANNDIM